MGLTCQEPLRFLLPAILAILPTPSCPWHVCQHVLWPASSRVLHTVSHQGPFPTPHGPCPSYALQVCYGLSSTLASSCVASTSPTFDPLTPSHCPHHRCAMQICLGLSCREFWPSGSSTPSPTNPSFTTQEHLPVLPGVLVASLFLQFLPHLPTILLLSPPKSAGLSCALQICLGLSWTSGFARAFYCISPPILLHHPRTLFLSSVLQVCLGLFCQECWWPASSQPSSAAPSRPPCT